MKTIGIAMLFFLGGCVNYLDTTWVIKPGEASDSIAIDDEPGDVVCVRELNEASETVSRTCVPRVHEEDEPQGET